MIEILRENIESISRDDKTLNQMILDSLIFIQGYENNQLRCDLKNIATNFIVTEINLIPDEFTYTDFGSRIYKIKDSYYRIIFEDKDNVYYYEFTINPIFK